MVELEHLLNIDNANTNEISLSPNIDNNALFERERMIKTSFSKVDKDLRQENKVVSS